MTTDRIRWTFVAAGLAVAVVAVWFLVRPPHDVASPPLEKARVRTFDIGGVPRVVTASDDGVWVGRGDRTLLKLDPEDASVVARTRLSFLPADLLLAGGSLWVGAIDGDRIARVDPITVEVLDEIRVGTTPQALAADADHLYVAAFDDGAVKQLDLAGGRIERTISRAESAFPSSVVAVYDGLWVSDVVRDVVSRLPTSYGSTVELPVGDSPTQVAAGEGSIWVANFNARTITRVDAASAEIAETIAVGAKPGAIAFGEGFLWVLRPATDSLIPIDASARRWTGDVYEVGDAPQDIAVTGTDLWIVSQDGTLTRFPITG